MLHVADRRVRQQDGRADAAQITLDQRHLGAVHGHIGAGPHGNTDIGFGQRRGIVDAVTRHGDDATLVLQKRDQRQFVGGFDFTAHFVNAQLVRHGFGGGQAIASRHDDAHAGFFE